MDKFISPMNDRDLDRLIRLAQEKKILNNNNNLTKKLTLYFKDVENFESLTFTYETNEILIILEINIFIKSQDRFTPI